MSEEKRRDLFVNIATHNSHSRKRYMITPSPLPLQPKMLPIDQKNPTPVFTPIPNINTKEALQIELEKYRTMYAPFQYNLAPPMDFFISRIPLETFQWRLQTQSDRLQFRDVLDGKGSWEEVAIPHYQGPIGKQTTYYRREITITQDQLANKYAFVCFRGVDYKAHVFMNDSYLGSHEGFFAPFAFDFTSCAREGKNTLVVVVENDSVAMSNNSWSLDQEGDKIYAATGPGWDDPESGWHHCPPGMGMYQDVTIELRSAIHVCELFVRPIPQDDKIQVWMEINNATLTKVKLAYQYSIYGQNTHQAIHEKIKRTTPALGPGINYIKFETAMKDYKPWNLETPWLYTYQVELMDDAGNRMSADSCTFGMRSFCMTSPPEPFWNDLDTPHASSSEPSPEYGIFYLNEKEIRLRGANTMGFEQQDVLTHNFQQLTDDILLAKICNMNFWRITQRPVQKEVYEYCDQLGFLVQTDLPLFGYLRRNQFIQAVKQAEEMEKLIRSHPSCVLISYINEPFPSNWENKQHRHLERDELERFFLAADQAVKINNPDRVIKACDGDYDPPGPGLPDNHCYSFWHNGHGVDPGKLIRGYWLNVKKGWRYACGEYGAEGLDPLDLMQRRYPEDWVPQSPEEDQAWQPTMKINAQSSNHHYMWYETPTGIEDWIQATHEFQALAMTLQTSAFRRNNQISSHAWHLFIDAFPTGFMKTLLDCERTPKPAYFACKDVLSPIMTHIRTDRFTYFQGESVKQEVWVCNDTHESLKEYRLAYQVIVDDGVIASGQQAMEECVCGSIFQGFLQFQLPQFSERTQFEVQLGLLKQSQVVYSHSQRFTVFPFEPTEIMPSTRACYLPSKHASLHEIVSTLHLNTTDTASANSLILIDPFEVYQKNQALYEEQVENGGYLLFYNLPEGTYSIFGQEIEVMNCSMRPRHFVSRDTGHALVKDFKPNDFRFWYHEKEDAIAPFINATFTAEHWNPILLCGNGFIEESWYPTLKPAFAAAVRNYGKGKIGICQVQCEDRLQTNPVCFRFAQRLFSGAWE